MEINARGKREESRSISYASAMTAKIPPTRARAGLLADAAPVKVAGAAVLALLVGALEGRLETVLMVGTMVVAGATEEAQVVGLVAGELAGGAGAAEEDAGGAHVAQVDGEEAGTGTTGEDAGADDQGPQVVDDVFAGMTGTVVVCMLVAVQTVVLVLVVADEDDQTPQAVLLETGETETGLDLLLLLDATDDEVHGPHVSEEELLLGTVGFAEVELEVVFAEEGVDDDQTPQDVVEAEGDFDELLLEPAEDDVHTPHVSDEDELLDLTGITGVVALLDFTDDDVHTPHVVDEDGVVLLDLTGETGVVVLLGFTDDDVHTPHVSDEDELLDLTGITGVVALLDFTEDDVDTPHVVDEDGVVLLDLTGEAGVVELLCDVQTPQDEEAAEVLPVLAGEDGVEDVC